MTTIEARTHDTRYTSECIYIYICTYIETIQFALYTWGYDPTNNIIEHRPSFSSALSTTINHNSHHHQHRYHYICKQRQCSSRHRYHHSLCINRRCYRLVCQLQQSSSYQSPSTLQYRRRGDCYHRPCVMRVWWCEYGRAVSAPCQRRVSAVSAPCQRRVSCQARHRTGANMSLTRR